MSSKEPELHVTVQHAREAGLCARGQRRWAEANHLDFSEFLANGLPVSVFDGIDDPYARQIAAYARKHAGEK